MGQPYVGEIRMFGGNFAPAGWAFCDGSLLAISENDVLFSLIGTTYGGDGQNTFALPDLRGRLPVHQGAGFVLAQSGGVEAVTLTVNQIPAHTHPLVGAAAPGDQVSPAGNVLAHSFSVTPYVNDVPTGAMNPGTVASAGGNQPHENMQPFLCVSFIISLFGIFPSPT
ncbi:MAG: tail fiber protein [Verrucomicrobia bacterium]|nr:tail fiber protein [Verrucomicrobiota bacterium]